MKTAAKAPKICITTPIFGIKTARTRVAINHTQVMVIRLLGSWLTTFSGDVRRRSIHKLSKAAL